MTHQTPKLTPTDQTSIASAMAETTGTRWLRMTDPWFTDEDVEKAAQALVFDMTKDHAFWDEKLGELARDFELRAARVALASVNPYEWRPIETAPKDGTEILVSITHNLPGDEWTTIQWVDWAYEDDEWFIFQERIDIPFPPTRWMSLPPAPEGDK